MKRAVVILPTYNERENIGLLIKALQQEFKTIANYSMSILVVDDNSPDGTQTVVRQMQQQYKNIYLLTGPKQGLGRAYLRGMDYAITKLKAGVMFEMDADFQHNPKQVSQFLTKLDEGYDIVVGARYIQGGSVPKNWGLHRKIFSRMGNLLVRASLMRFGQHEWTNGFRAIRSQAYVQVRDKLLAYTGYTFQVAFLHQAFLLGKKIGEIPNKFDERRWGRSKIGAEYVKNLLIYLGKQTLINPPQFFKFLAVGGIGFIVQFVTFRIFRGWDWRPSVATTVSAEIAIGSNFLWNNLWTFADQKISAVKQILIKFPQFNLTSLGSIVIQAIISEIGTRTFGIQHLAFSINSDDVYLMIGILIGLIWNYTMYKLVIWKK
jgi:dolichol-phosphate mannosyltransferase